MSYRLAADVGGTFTDVVLINEDVYKRQGYDFHEVKGLIRHAQHAEKGEELLEDRMVNQLGAEEYTQTVSYTHLDVYKRQISGS